MTAAGDDSLQTRQSLLSRLRNVEDQESWRVFFDRYWHLLYNVARRAGLDDPGAQDIVQETVIAVARKMPGFHYDPERGTFRQWLLRITQRRIVDYLRKRYREPRRADMPPEALEDEESPLGTIAEQAADLVNEIWEEEWKQAMFDAAVAVVRRQANPKQFQIFDYSVIRGWPASKVAATLGVNSAQVYLAKHRVAQAVKRVARKLAQEERRDGGL